MTVPHRSPIAVLGAGVRTPAGNTVDELWENLCAATATAERFEDDRLPVGALALACRVLDFDPASVLTPIEARRLDRSHALAFAAAQEALDQCGDLPPPERRAVVCGVGLPAATTYEQQWTQLMTGGVRAVTPLLIPLVMPSTIASHLSIRFDLQGPCLTVSAACASGAAAIAEGVELLRRGAADLVLAGGVDSLVTYGPMCGFIRLDAMSRNVDRPELASRPFDVDRDGFVMGEGAGFVVLTRAADARVGDGLGLVLGHASTADAHHLVAPAPDGRGALRCMSLALADAGIDAADVAHVNAHGTSTVLNDLVEAQALAALLDGSSAPVTAVKGSTGHMIGASGAVEAIVSLAAIGHGLVPPVTGLRTVDPACSIDVVHDRPREVPAGPVLSNSFGFGGTNTVLVLGPPA